MKKNYVCYISTICPQAPRERICVKFSIEVLVVDVITFATFWRWVTLLKRLRSRCCNDERFCLSVCLSVCLFARIVYLRNHRSKLY